MFVCILLSCLTKKWFRGNKHFVKEQKSNTDTTLSTFLRYYYYCYLFHNRLNIVLPVRNRDKWAKFHKSH